MNARVPLLTVAFLWLGIPAVVPAQTGGDYDLSWNTIDGGGIMFAAGGEFELAGTIGQADASPVVSVGGDFELMGGFWAVVPRCTSFVLPDLDQDCDVDADDLAIFAACALGPEVPYHPALLPLGCTLIPQAGLITADFDADGDVDVDDFALFQRCYTGAGRVADLWCDD